MSSAALRPSLYAIAAGLVVALAVWLLLPAPQPPPFSLAVCDQGGVLVIAEPGAGFYGVERKSDRRWTWAGGPATLALKRYDESKQPAAVRLRFTLRSLSPREVTVHCGGFVLWKGDLPGLRAAVDIPVLTLTGPVTELTLTSNQPGTLAADGKDPRPLAFAIYDLKLTPAE